MPVWFGSVDPAGVRFQIEASGYMENQVLFRPARAEDWPAVAALLGQARLPLAGVQEHLSEFVLAWRNEMPVGVAGLERYDSVALLRSVAVAPPERGQGLGSALVQHLLGRACSQGIRQIVLLTESAADFFPRFGFRPIERGAAPEGVWASAEFQGACPVSATVMQLDLG